MRFFNQTRLGVLLAALVPAALGAQGTQATEPTTASWVAWVGCWAPAVEAGTQPRSLTTCVLPGDAPQAVEIVTVAGDSVAMRSTLTADGVARPVTGEGCTGTESARFSEDGARVYVAGEVTCGDGPTQRTSGVLSISETGEWIDVHGVLVGEQQNLRVRRSRPAPVPAVLGASERAELARLARATAGARLAASLSTSPARVIDAAAALDPRVTEAWVIESSRDAARIEPVDRKAVLALADAKVPARVIDVMVALSYPKHFQVVLADDGRSALDEVEQGGSVASGAHARALYPDVFGYSLYGPGSCITYSCFAFYRDWNYYNYYRGLAGWDFYGGYGMYPGWGYGAGPIIIVPGGGSGGGSADRGGRVVKGQGYRRNGTSGGETAEPRATASPSAGSGTRTATRRTEPSTSSGRTQEKPAQSEPRTAKPRRP